MGVSPKSQVTRICLDLDVVVDGLLGPSTGWEAMSLPVEKRVVFCILS